jgi:hypothetical protein
MSDPGVILNVNTESTLRRHLVSTTVIPMPAPPATPKTSQQSSPLPGLLQDMNLDDLESELLTLAGHIAAAECRFLQYLAEFDDRRGWVGDGIRSCAHWLTWRAGMNVRTATEHLRIAHALTHLPKISEAFAAGQISYSKGRALTRITGTDTSTLARIGAATAAGDPRWRHSRVADPETAERVLLNLALSGTASHVETVVSAVRRMDTPPEDTAARRSLAWRHNEDGSLQVTVRFTPDAGAEFIAAINALVPPRTPVQRPGERSQADLDERAREQEPGPVVDRLAARRADALLALVTGTTDDGPGPVVERGKAQVIVHFDGDSGAARIAGGPVIPAPTPERLFCDARVQLLLDDRDGNRMYLGRSRRLATRPRSPRSPSGMAAAASSPGAPTPITSRRTTWFRGFTVG